MTAELFTTTASAWAVFFIAGLGIAVLPWSAAEVRESAAAFAALPGLVSRLVTRRPPLEAVAEPVTVPSGF